METIAEFRVGMGLSRITLVLLAAGLTLLILLRFFGFLKPGARDKLPAKSAPAGNRVSRAAEAIIMLCGGIAILVFTATNPSTNGMLLMLDRLRPAFAATNVIVALCAAVGVLLAALICRLWRTLPAVFLMTIVLSAYGCLLNGLPGDLLERLAPEGSARPKVPFLLRLSKSNVVGAELWVNGVFLGKTPVQTTLEEFLEDVPYWPEPPEGYRDETDEVHEPHYNPRGGRGYSIYQRWMRFELPEAPQQYRIGPGPETEGKYYYARVKYDDEWGYFEGGGGGGGGGGRYTYTAERHFPAVFPKRRQRLKEMLDKARLSDYRVDADWFGTMETFGQDGPLAVREAMDKEPGMINVLNDWARWKYDLDKVTDAESAWSVFQRICAEADLLGSYSTADIAGRAVELLTPHLDAERLVEKAVKLIRSTRNYGWSSWVLNGRLQFGFSNRPEGLATGLVGILFGSHGGRGDRLPVSGYAVAHAVWMLDEYLDAQDDSKPNIVERKVVPALICWHNDWIWSLRIAACLGGPDIGRFLWRQDWRAGADGVPFKQRMRMAGEDVNGWLFLLANLRTGLGAKFRRERSRALMDMADKIRPESIEDYGLLGQNPFGFLFIDKSLALKYWPRFRARAASHDRGYSALRQQFHYLVSMEPVSTVEMYVDAWRAYSHDYGNFQEAFSALDNLGESKREKVISAIEQAIREDVSHIKGFPGDEDGCRDYLLRHIEDDEWTANRQARDIMENLEAGTDEYKGDAVAAWLEHSKPDHPLLKMLAESDQPQLRLLVMGAIRAHPTPHNREILQKLLSDESEQVRAAAAEVRENLKDLAAAQFEELKGEGPPRFEISMKHVIISNLLRLRQPIIVISTIVLLLLLAAGLSLRQLRSKTKRTTISASAPVGAWTTQIAEAIVLLCAGSAVLAVLVYDDRVLRMLNDVKLPCAAPYLSAAVSANVLLAMAVGVALLWRTSAGVVLATVVLFSYSLLLGTVLQRHRVPADCYKGSYTITVSTPYAYSFEGADLWVNGVYLGKTPVKTTIEDFLQKVPHWDEAPEEEDGNDTAFIVPQYRATGVSQRRYPYWIRFSVPVGAEFHERYYARVRLAGEWGHKGSQAGAGGGGERGHADSSFEVIFPQRNERIETLLDKARLSDYRVDSGWFEAMESYGKDGWMSLRKAMDNEPEMATVLDDWAIWRYDLDEVTDSKSAWRALEKICRDADRQHYYISASVMGRAVELLVPTLNPKQLAGRALKILSSNKLYGWLSWQAGDTWYFGASDSGQGFITSWGRAATCSYGFYRHGRYPSREYLPAGAYAVGHAIWKLDELLDCRDDSRANIVERKVAPAIIAWNYKLTWSLIAASYLGGPEVERFLLIKNGRPDPDKLRYYEQRGFDKANLNHWQYLLANLHTAAGDTFRRENSEYVFKLADVLYEETFTHWNEELNFLFLDLDRGKESLACKYWPRFEQHARKSRNHALKTQWWYLLKMEPVSTVSMYVDSWRQTNIESGDLFNAVELLEQLPAEKRQAVIKSIVRQVQTSTDNLRDDDMGPNRMREYALRELEVRLPPGGVDETVAIRILDGLNAKSADYKPENVATWLEHERPDHPLVRMLADCENPEFRILVMGAIKSHPTPHNREILQKLLSGENEQVRAAAGTVVTELEALSQMPPCDLAPQPPGRIRPQ